MLMDLSVPCSGDHPENVTCSRCDGMGEEVVEVCCGEIDEDGDCFGDNCSGEESDTVDCSKCSGCGNAPPWGTNTELPK